MSDLVQIEQIEQKTFGSNYAQTEIARLRKTAQSEEESPVERLRAAASLLTRHGASRRNQAVIQSTIKLFINSSDNEVAQRAKKLKVKLLKAVDLDQAASAEMPEVSEVEAPVTPVAEPIATQEREQVKRTPSKLPVPVYPPEHIVFPPPDGIYTLGSVDLAVVLERLDKGGAIHFEDHPSRHEGNEKILRIALAISDIQPITLDRLQELSFALEYERPPQVEGPVQQTITSLFSRLFGAMYYYAGAHYGYNSLKKAPLNPTDPNVFGHEFLLDLIEREK
jgi:hypothetical protein